MSKDETLIKAAEEFELYAREHRQKAKDWNRYDQKEQIEKAERNELMARMCREARLIDVGKR